MIDYIEEKKKKKKIYAKNLKIWINLISNFYK